MYILHGSHVLILGGQGLCLGLRRHPFVSIVQFDGYFTGCESQDSYSSVVGDLSLLGCYTVSTGKLLLTFRSIVEFYVP